MIKVKRIQSFDNGLKNLYTEDKKLRKIVEEVVVRFQKNPGDTRLRNHKLKRRLKGKWAFSITGDVRIVYEWQGKNTVRFLAIGTHPQVYR